MDLLDQIFLIRFRLLLKADSHRLYLTHVAAANCHCGKLENVLNLCRNATIYHSSIWKMKLVRKSLYTLNSRSAYG